MNRKNFLRRAGSALMALAVLAGGSSALLAQQTENVSITVNAASKVWNGGIDTSWYNSSKSIFYINTPEQLAGLAKLVSDGNTMAKKGFVLTADLVMNDTSNFANWEKNPPKNNWVPIGAKPNGQSSADLVTGIKATAFEGSFNGNGHTITGLYCNHEMYGGLFAVLNLGSVVRTIMKNCYICADEPIQSESSYRIWKLFDKKEYFKYPDFIPIAGGIAAVSNSSCISECEFNGKVLAIGNDDYSIISNGREKYGVDVCAGGIVGRYSTSLDLVMPFLMTISPIGVGTAFQPLEYLDWVNSVTNGCGIYNCVNKGSVHTQYSKWKNVRGTEFLNDRAYTGGIAGFCDVTLDGQNAEIKHCASFGRLTSGYEPVGGIVGISSGIILEDNYYANANQACVAKPAGAAGTYADRVDYYDTKGHAVRCADTVDNRRIIANNFGKLFNFYNNDIRLNCDLVCHNGPIILNKTSMSLGKNETTKLTASIIDSTITNKSVKWRTSAPKILTVDQSGNVKAVGTGTAWITARASSGAEKSCKITVKNAPAKVSLSKGDFAMGVGETFTLSAVLPDGTAAAKRTFRTSNSSIIKMTKTDWTGTFKALKTGVAWVTVRLYNGVEKSCKITVKPAPTNVYVNKKTLTLKVGQTAKVSAYLNSGAACATRTFRTSNSSIVKMTRTNWEGEFKAMKKGVAWVTVRTYNGKEASCKVTVV